MKVGNDGSLTVVGDMPTGYERADVDGDNVRDNAFSFMVTDPFIGIDLYKVSSSNSNVELEGAQFRLTGMCLDNNTTHTFTTDEDGHISIDQMLLADEKYTLYEDVTPAGYIEVDPFTFSVNMDGELGWDGELPKGWSVADDGVTLTVADDPVVLQIQKLDPDGNGLPGAVFSIDPVDGSAFSDGSTDPIQMQTGADGVLSMSGPKLVVGNTYDITEVSAPDGFERVTGTMRVTVGEDGSINVVGSVGADGQLEGMLPPDGYEKAADSTFTVQVTNEPIEIGIVKVDATDTATPLAGATFEVTGVFADSATGNSETRSYTTNDQGRIDFEAELTSGETYTLRETVAPVGFELIEGELAFEVHENGELSPVDELPAGYSIEQGNVTIAAADQPLHISLVKHDENGEPLEGAAFEVSGRFVDGMLPRVITVGEDGTAPIEGVVAGETYTLRETRAPEGFELIAGELTFAVNADGTLAPAEGYAAAEEGEPGYRVASDGVTLVATDAPIELTLSKVSTEGEALAGAEFEVTGKFADGSTTQKVVVGEDGTAPIEGAVAGETYQIRETLAPEGFDLIEGTWAFTVAADGTIAPAEGVEAATEGAVGYRVADGSVTLVATDAATPPEEEGPPVETPPEEPPVEMPPAEPPVEGPPAEPPAEEPPAENPPDEPKLPDTSDATRPTVQVALAAGGVAMIAAALAYRRHERREDQ